MLYSLNSKYPQVLPDRIRLPDGSTKTDKNTFTESDITNAGYVLVNDPPIIGDSDLLRWNGADWVVVALTQEEKINNQWARIRELRDNTIKNFQWRIERYFSEVRLNIIPKDNISVLDEYVQGLRDITKQQDPFNIVWPQEPV